MSQTRSSAAFVRVNSEKSTTPNTATCLIANEIESGREVQLGDGTKATLIDQFADKMTVFRPLGVSRYEIELENV
jgi:hypothetical protein